MKRLFGFALFCLLLVIPLAAASSSESVTLPETLQLNSATLPPGEYRVTWTESGTSAQVTLEKSGTTPVTATAKIVQQKNKRSFVSMKTENGREVLESISLKNLTLIF